MTQPFILVGSGVRRRPVRLSIVQEILSLMEQTPVEDLSGTCRGMANLRGEIMPIFDTMASDAQLSPSHSVLITRFADSSIGLIVDDAHEAVGDEMLAPLDPREILHPAQG